MWSKIAADGDQRISLFIWKLSIAQRTCRGIIHFHKGSCSVSSKGPVRWPGVTPSTRDEETPALKCISSSGMKLQITPSMEERECPLNSLASTLFNVLTISLQPLAPQNASEMVSPAFRVKLQPLHSAPGYLNDLAICLRTASQTHTGFPGPLLVYSY